MSDIRERFGISYLIPDDKDKEIQSLRQQVAAMRAELDAVRKTVYKSKNYRGHEENRREKIGIEKLFVLSPANEALIAEAKRLQTEAKQLEEQAQVALSGLVQIVVPTD